MATIDHQLIGYKMKNYVISLTSALDRRKHIEREFGKQQVEFEFFDAITPDTVKLKIHQLLPNICIDRISLGELACCVSHMVLWQHAIDQNMSHIAIFEDDIFLGEHAQHFLMQSDWLHADWDIVKLETFYERTFIEKSSTDVLSRQVSRLNASHFGAAGYILSNAAIQKIFQTLRSSHNLSPIDHILFSNQESLFGKLNIQQLSPALCIQEKILKDKTNLSNALDIYRQQWRPPKEKMNFYKKILREFHRLAKQIRFFLFAQVISFK